MEVPSSSISSSYDVFLSFRGEDTRFGFAAHLYDALEKKGVNAFFDHYKIRAGESISPTLKKAIEGSRSSVVILSKNFANSSWCLEELVMILERRKTTGQLVFPIFYGVDPSDVRKHQGSFGEALVEHEKDLKPAMVNKVKKWREALTEVGNLSGWDSRNKSEPTFIKEIVIDVLKQLSESSSTHVISTCSINKDSSCVPNAIKVVIPSPLATTVNIGANYGTISGSDHSNPFKNVKDKVRSKLEDVRGNTVEFVVDMLDKAENSDTLEFVTDMLDKAENELKFKFKKCKAESSDTMEFVTDMLDKAENELKFKFKKCRAENFDSDKLKFMFKRSMCKIFDA